MSDEIINTITYIPAVAEKWILNGQDISSLVIGYVIEGEPNSDIYKVRLSLYDGQKVSDVTGEMRRKDA